MRRFVAAVMAGVMGVGAAAPAVAQESGGQAVQQTGESDVPFEFECEHRADECGGAG